MMLYWGMFTAGFIIGGVFALFVFFPKYDREEGKPGKGISKNPV